jgi:signal transduction histidine kinase
MLVPSSIKTGGVMSPLEFVSRTGCAGEIIDKQYDLSPGSKLQRDPSYIKAFAVYNLRQELEGIRESFLADAKAKRIDLSLAIAESLPVVFWDMGSLREHFFNNIISNAIRSSSAGGRISIIIKKLDDYMMSINILDSASDSSACKINPVNAEQCILAHNGLYEIADSPIIEARTIKVEIPLYSLCMQ